MSNLPEKRLSEGVDVAGIRRSSMKCQLFGAEAASDSLAVGLHKVLPNVRPFSIDRYNYTRPSHSLVASPSLPGRSQAHAQFTTQKEERV